MRGEGAPPPVKGRKESKLEVACPHAAEFCKWLIHHLFPLFRISICLLLAQRRKSAARFTAWSFWGLDIRQILEVVGKSFHFAVRYHPEAGVANEFRKREEPRMDADGEGS